MYFFQLTNQIHTKLNKSKRIITIFIDLARAFDSLDRDILLQKYC